MSHDNNMHYYGLGMRDAYANVATMIRAGGLIKATEEILDTLHELNPENPHIKPARLRVAECKAALKGGD